MPNPMSGFFIADGERGDYEENKSNCDGEGAGQDDWKRYAQDFDLKFCS
jgi:hypothetical protein